MDDETNSFKNYVYRSHGHKVTMHDLSDFIKEPRHKETKTIKRERYKYVLIFYVRFLMFYYFIWNNFSKKLFHNGKHTKNSHYIHTYVFVFYHPKTKTSRFVCSRFFFYLWQLSLWRSRNIRFLAITIRIENLYS